MTRRSSRTSSSTAATTTSTNYKEVHSDDELDEEDLKVEAERKLKLINKKNIVVQVNKVETKEDTPTSPKRARRRSLRTRQSNIPNPLDSDDEQQEEEEPSSKSNQSPVKLKPKRTAKSVQVKPPQAPTTLESIIKMPLDILAEIFSHLLSSDLISISRSNKLFRNLLLNENGTHFWIQMRRMNKIPDLHGSDLSEYQYALLLEGKNCSFCGLNEADLRAKGSGNVITKNFYLRVNYCHECSKTQVVPGHKANEIPESHRLATECVPYSEANYYTGGRAGWRHHARSGVGPKNHLLRDLKTASDELWFHELQHDILQEKAYYSKLKAQGSRFRKVTVAIPVEESSFDNFVAEKKVWVEKIFQNGKTLLEVEKQQAERKLEIAQEERRRKERAVEDRAKQIEEKARSLGYDDHVIGMAKHHLAPLYSQSGPLTEEQWKAFNPSKHFYPYQQMQDKWKLDRSQQERQEDLRPFYLRLLAQQSKESKPTFPLFSDFAHLPTVKNKLWLKELGPESEDGSGLSELEKKWNANLPQIEEEIEDHIETIRVEIVRLILNVTTGEGKGKRSTSLPATIYNEEFFDKPTSALFCLGHDCEQVRLYPDILLHQHECHPDGTRTWSGKRYAKAYRTSIAFVGAIKAILNASDIDPETATSDVFASIMDKDLISNQEPGARILPGQVLSVAIKSSTPFTAILNLAPVGANLRRSVYNLYSHGNPRTFTAARDLEDEEEPEDEDDKERFYTFDGDEDDDEELEWYHRVMNEDVKPIVPTQEESQEEEEEEKGEEIIIRSATTKTREESYDSDLDNFDPTVDLSSDGLDPTLDVPTGLETGDEEEGEEEVDDSDDE